MSVSLLGLGLTCILQHCCIEDFVCLVMIVRRNILRKRVMTKSVSDQHVLKKIQGFVILNSHLETANSENQSDICMTLLVLPRVHQLLMKLGISLKKLTSWKLKLNQCSKQIKGRHPITYGKSLNFKKSPALTKWRYP